jgi:hypothetical protein
MTDRIEQLTYQELLEILGADFDRRMVDDPSFLDELPAGACVCIQILVTDAMERNVREYIIGFNKWSHDVSTKQLRPGQPFCVARCSMRSLVGLAASDMTRGVACASCGEYELIVA